MTVTNTASSGTTSTVASTFYLDDAARTVDDGQATTRYGYTGSGKPTSRVQASNGATTAPPTTSYAYNDADVATNSTASMVAGSTGTPWSWTYDAAGRTLTERDPNGQQTERSYNPDDTLLFQRTLTAGSGGRTVAASTFRHDGLFRRVRQDTSSMDEQGGTSSRTELFAYTPAGRVSGYDDGDGMFTASWDADGNRLRYTRPAAPGRTAVDERAAYHPDDSLASSATTDDTGAPTPSTPAAYTGFGALKDDGCTSYGYDGFDRTTSAQPTPGSRCANGTGTSSSTSWTYDGLDRQRSRTQTDTTKTTAGAASTAPAATTDLHYDGLGSTVAAETTRTAGSSTTPAEAMWTLDPDNDAKSVTTAGPAGKSNYLTDDGHGTIATITNDTAGAAGTGFVACAARLDPWGKPQSAGTGLSPTGASASPCKGGSSSTANDKFYRGLRRDNSTGTYQMGSRTYNPNRAAFLSQDSYRTAPTSAELGVGVDPLTMNRYTYVNGDPINYVDPDGHKPWWKKAGDGLKSAGKATGKFIGDHKSDITAVVVTGGCLAVTGGAGSVGCAAAGGAVKGAIDAHDSCKGKGQAACYAGHIGGEAAAGAALGKGGELAGRAVRSAAEKYGTREGAVGAVARKLAGSCNCFPAGTQVATSQGKQAIEKIAVGDSVWARSLSTGRSQLRHVVGLFHKQAAGLLTITAGATVLQVTTQHPFWVPGRGWTDAGKLTVGNQLMDRDGHAVRINNISYRAGQVTVYNFEVEGDHNYYITKAQLLVHNCPASSAPNFEKPTNPSAHPPKDADLPEGHSVRRMGATEQYPHGYWRQTNGNGQPVDPSTGKPPGNVTKAQARARTHVPLPKGE